MGSPPQPEEGDIRFNGNDVELFDGTAWVRHEELPDDQTPPEMRGEDGGDDDPGARPPFTG
ncbi:hypothetical protein [Streptomyces californicus]|uniref:hypothetical protein n=1 Tax=Streptomyces californicus TaxID=67351 RepID=UPI003792B309